MDDPIFFAMPHLPGAALDALVAAGIRTVRDLIAYPLPVESIAGLTPALAERVRGELERTIGGLEDE